MEEFNVKIEIMRKIARILLQIACMICMAALGVVAFCSIVLIF